MNLAGDMPTPSRHNYRVCLTGSHLMPAQEIYLTKMGLWVVSALNVAASLPFDPFSSEPLHGAQAITILMAGSIGGALMSTLSEDTVAKTVREWAWRIFIATIVGFIFTPFAILNFSLLTTKAAGFAVTHNASTVLATSAALSLSAKIVIRRVHQWWSKKK